MGIYRSSALLAASAATLLTCVASYACPDGYYNTPLGVCLPNSGTVTKTVTRPITEVATQLAGPALEQWIIQSRNSAIGGSQPIPWNIRNQLQAYFPERVLNIARFKVGDNGIVNAARTAMNNADVSAVTLIDVIVFRNASDAASNVTLWAHELLHVQQYADWGTRDFALRYTRDSNAVENAAYAMENRVASEMQARAASPPPPPPIVASPGAGGTGIPVRFCQTPAGTCSIPPTFVPMGTPCNCSLPNGQQVFGRAF